jgi:hypothetical protein
MTAKSIIMKMPLLLLAAATTAAAPPATPAFPARQQAGPFTSGHVQGIAVDRRNGHIYYSFTNLLAKYDLEGRLLGTLVGWTGHLGDLDFNDADGKVYGSLEYGKQNAFYITVIDGARIDRVGIPAHESGILRAVYLPEVTRDYTAPGHRYGCSGIDGVAFGPAFGRTKGPLYLTVAYGIYGDTNRQDNDHQVLLQYDAAEWSRIAQPLDEAKLQRAESDHPRAKVFVRTGNTRYGVQNLAYDPGLRRWFMGVYKGSKPHFPNYSLFAIEARARPVQGDLMGVPSSRGDKWERGLLLPLAVDGHRDPATGLHGWHQKADVGFQPLGKDTYYVVAASGRAKEQQAQITLMRWSGDPAQPFRRAANDTKEVARN